MYIYTGSRSNSTIQQRLYQKMESVPYFLNYLIVPIYYLFEISACHRFSASVENARIHVEVVIITYTGYRSEEEERRANRGANRESCS